MAKKITYTLDLDANLGDLESKLSNLKNQLSTLMQDGKNNALVKSFGSIEKAIDSMRQKTSSPITSQAMFGSLQKDLGTISSNITKLTNNINAFKNSADGEALSLLPSNAVQQLNQALVAYSKLSDFIDKGIAETTELKNAKKELLVTEQKLAEKQSSLGTQKEARNATLVQIESIQKQIKASEELIKQREEEVEAAEKAYKELEEIYNVKKQPKNKKITLDDGSQTSLAKARNKVNSAKDRLNQAEGQKSGLDSQLESSEKAYSAFEANIAKAADRVQQLQTVAEVCATKVAKLQESFNLQQAQNAATLLDQYKQSAQELGISLDGLLTGDVEQDLIVLTTQFGNLAASIKGQADEALQGIQEEFAETGTVAKEMSDAVSNGAVEMERMDSAAKKADGVYNKIKEFVGAAGAVRVFQKALRDAFSTVKELDAVMTEMAVVTELDVGDYWDQLPEYAKRANELGVSIKSAYDSATLFYQQGLSTNEVVALSNQTLKMARIAGLDAAEATDRMTAALRGFNMELNETSAQKVADVYSELAAITASDVDEISTAMTKTASIASNAGMEFETTAAFLSQIIETTRESAETAGTAMKTVIARFQELKKDPSEIGEVDGEIVDANKIETALRSVGVALRDSNGQFRDLDDVFIELASKWQSLDTNTQRYIATIAAGSRQQSRFIAMMSDYARTQDLVNAAQNSAGASSRQYEKTLESLESKLAQLKNAWDTFVTGILNSDLIKFFVDLLTKALTVINNLTKGFNGFTSSFSKISVIFAAFKTGQVVIQTFGDKIRSVFGGFGTSFGDGIVKGIETATAKAGPKAQELGRQLVQQGVAGAQTASQSPEQASPGETQAPQKKSLRDRVFGGVAAVGQFLRTRSKPQELPKEDQDLNTFASSQMSYGQDMLQSAVQGGAAQISAAVLPWDEIKAQFEEKMAAMGQSTQQIEEAWNRCAAQFQQGSTTVQQALQTVNNELDEASAGVTEIEQKNKKKGNTPQKRALERKDRRITITAKTKGATKGKKDNTEKDEKKKQKAYKKTRKEIEKTGKSKEKTGEKGKKIDEGEVTQQDEVGSAYDKVASNVGKFGAAVTGVGVAFGVAGAAFDSLGMPGIGEAFTKVGTAVTMVGGAISLLSSIMSLASVATKLFEKSNKSAEKQQKKQMKTSIAQFATNILAALGFTSAGIAALFAQASFLPLLVVTLAILAVFVALIATLAIVVVTFMAIASVFKKVAAASPAKQLEAAQAAADKAAEAADRAAEAYNHLKDSLESLDGKYKALEELTEGTREWEDAVKEINDEVLDLIKLYPSLAKEVENVNGVLRLDVESESVQNTLNEAQARAASAKAIEYDAQQKVIEKQTDVKRSELDEKNTIGNKNLTQMTRLYSEGIQAYGKILSAVTLGTYAPVGLAINEVGKLLGKGIDQMEDNQNAQTDAMAEALARGVVIQQEDGSLEVTNKAMAEELGITAGLLQKYEKKLEDGTDELAAYGAEVIAAKEQMNAFSQAMASAAVEAALAGRDLSSSMEKMVDNIADAMWADEISKKHANDYQNLKKKDKKAAREQIAQEMYGDTAKVDRRGKKISYKDETSGETVTVDMTDSEWAQFYNAGQAEDERVAYAEKLPEAIEEFISVASTEYGVSYKSLERLLTNQEGSELTQKDINELIGLTEEELTELYYSNDAIKAGFPSLQTFLDKTDQARKLGEETNRIAIEKLAESMSSITGESKEQTQEALKNSSFNKLNAGSIKAFAEDLDALILATDPNNTESVKQFSDKIETLVGEMDEEEANAFIRALTDTDWTDNSALNKLTSDLKNLGVEIPDSEIKDFINSLKETGTVMNKIPFEKLQENVRGYVAALQSLRGSKNKTIDKDTYQSIKEILPDLAEQFQESKTGDYVFLGESFDAFEEGLRQSTLDTKNSLQYYEDVVKAAEKNQEKFDVSNYETWSDEKLKNFLSGMANINETEFQHLTNVNSQRINDLNSEQLKEAASKVASVVANKEENKDKLQQVSELDRQNMQYESYQDLIATLKEYQQSDESSGVIKEDQTNYAKILALKAAELGVNTDYKKILEMTTEGLVEFENALKKATEAEEAIAELENEYGKINRGIAKSEDLSSKREMLSQEYNLENYGKTVSGTRAKEYAQAYTQNLADSIANANLLKDEATQNKNSIADLYKDYIKFENGEMIVDTEKAESEGVLENVTTAADALTQYDEIIAEQDQALLDLQEEQNDIIQESNDSYTDLLGQTKDALINTRQEEIDQLQSLNDSIADAQQAIVDKMQEQIQEQRQARQNSEKEQELTDKQQRLQALRRDTSGANASEIAKLEKELAKDTQSYQDSLVDQELNKLSKQNEEASKQRQKQIDILQAQLDLWSESGGATEEAQSIIENSLTKIQNGENLLDTELGKLLSKDVDFSQMSPEEKTAWEKETSELINLVTTGKAIADSVGKIAGGQQPEEGGGGAGKGTSLGTVQPNDSSDNFTTQENQEDSTLNNTEEADENLWNYLINRTLPALWKLIKEFFRSWLFFDEIVQWAVGFLETAFIPLWDAIKNVGLAIWEVLTYLWDALIGIFEPIIRFITEVAEILTSEEDGKFGKLWSSLGSNLWDLIKGLWSAIVGYFATLGTFWGGKIIPAIIDVLQFVIGFVFQAVLGLIPLLIDYILGWVTKVLDVLFNGWGTKIAQAITGKEGNVHILQTLWDKLMKGLTAIIDGISDIWLWVVDFVLILINFFKDFNGKQTGKKLKKWLDRAWKGIKDSLSGVVDFFSDLIQMFTRGIDAMFGTNWTEGIQGFVQDLSWDTIKNFFVDKLSTMWDTISSAFTDWWNSAKSLAVKIKDFFVDKLSTMWDIISSAFTTWWTGTKSLAAKIKEFFTTKLPTMWDTIITAFSNWWTGAKSLAAKIKDFFVDKLSTMWETISSAFTEWWNGEDSLPTKIKEFFVEKIPTIWDTISSAFTDWWNGEDSLAAKIKDFFVDKLSTIWETISSAFTEWWTGEDSLAAKIKEFFVEKIPQIGSDFQAAFPSIDLSVLTDSIKGMFRELLQTVANVYNNMIEAIWGWGIEGVVTIGSAAGGLGISKESLQIIVPEFKTGGLADFTGPAWLDGTPSKPEIVLNQRDSQNFIALRDILSDSMRNGNFASIGTNSSEQSASYYDIDINVDSIANDYDVEQMADKIKSMIYEDSMYRNVNTIKQMR